AQPKPVHIGHERVGNYGAYGLAFQHLQRLDAVGSLEHDVTLHFKLSAELFEIGRMVIDDQNVHGAPPLYSFPSASPVSPDSSGHQWILRFVAREAGFATGIASPLGRERDPSSSGSISAAGTGLLYRNPCASSHLTNFNNCFCSLVSTPSATT